MKITLGTFKNYDDTLFVALIINSHTSMIKGVQDIVGSTLMKLNLDEHVLYASQKQFGIGFGTAQVVFNYIRKAVETKKETVMNKNGGNCILDEKYYPEVSREILELDNSINLRVLLMEKNNNLN